MGCRLRHKYIYSVQGKEGKIYCVQGNEDNVY